MTELFPPFDPDENNVVKRKRRPRIAFRMIAPNLVTLLALCAGLTSIRMGMENKFDYAVGAIILAAVLDAVDGRVARLLNASSRFGAELDSLADFVNFGVAPAILLYMWDLRNIRSLGWIAALLFAICMALRLARFNAALDAETGPAWKANFFVGVPAPAGAMLALLPLYLSFLGMPKWPGLSQIVMFYLLFISFLVVSRVPTFSGKKTGMRIKREWVLPLFVAVVAYVALLVSYPFEVLAAMAIGYLVGIPFGWKAYRRLNRQSVKPATHGEGKTASAPKDRDRTSEADEKPDADKSA